MKHDAVQSRSSGVRGGAFWQLPFVQHFFSPRAQAHLGVDPEFLTWGHLGVMEFNWQQAALGASAVFFTLHVRNHGGELKSVIRSIWSLCKNSAHFVIKNSSEKDEDKRKAQVEAGLWDVRARTYCQCAKFLLHVSALMVLGQLYALYLDPGLEQRVQLFFGSCVYLTHQVVNTEKLSPAKLRILQVFLYALFVPYIMAKPGDGCAITQGFNVGSRMIMSVVFMDTLIAVPAQIVISLVETSLHESRDNMLFAWMQTLVCSSIIGFSIVLEFWVRSHISVLLDTESMLSSFRRMLRGVSDGEVLLNRDMQVCEDADCLKHLLMTHSNFQGKDFERLVVPEDVGRFQDFLNQSIEEVRKPGTKTPPCLRICLRGASDIRVGVDLWHVLMPGRKDGMLHMLVLREDSEARALPNAPKSAGNISHISPSASTGAGDSEREASESSSQKSVSSLLHTFPEHPELVDMTLCVDASTQGFDVEQAHLSFQRATSSATSSSSISSISSTSRSSSSDSMPSLRRLVRPTDWETLRSKLQRLSEVAANDAAAAPSRSRRDGRELRLRLRLVDDAKRSMIAKGRVSIYKPPAASGATSEGKKLCLQLTEMAFDKNPRDWNLTAINE